LVCYRCQGSGTLIIPNGESSFDKEICETCSGVGSLPEYEDLALNMSSWKKKILSSIGGRMNHFYSVTIIYQKKRQKSQLTRIDKVLASCIENAKDSVLDQLRLDTPELKTILEVWAEKI